MDEEEDQWLADLGLGPQVLRSWSTGHWADPEESPPAPPPGTKPSTAALALIASLLQLDPKRRPDAAQVACSPSSGVLLSRLTSRLPFSGCQVKRNAFFCCEYPGAFERLVINSRR